VSGAETAGNGAAVFFLAHLDACWFGIDVA
jgi:hypothetical protein